MLCFIPFELTISQKREFVVIGANNKPIEGALSKQVWYQYSLNHRKDVEVKSDSLGKILFPKRVVRTNLISIISGAVARIIEYKIDANIGSTDTIGVFVEGQNWQWFYDGAGLESGVVRF